MDVPVKLRIDYLLNSDDDAPRRAPAAHAASASASAFSSSSSSSSSASSAAAAAASAKRPFACHICGFAFTQRSDCAKHVRTVHLRQRPFSCSYCSQTFGEKGNLYVCAVAPPNPPIRQLTF